MSQIVVAKIRHPDLALTPTIVEMPEASIQVIPHSATDAETGMFFFLVKLGDESTEPFESALERDHTVDKWLSVTASGMTNIYRISHTDETRLISPKAAELGGLMLEATSGDRGWTVQLHLPDREALSELWSYCREEEISIELRRVYRQEGWAAENPTGLTEAQRVALVMAYENGYFEEPRGASLEDLADQLDLSPTAVGGRLRRGTAELIEETLIDV